MSEIAATVLVTVLAAITVSLWTARVALAASGRRLASSIVAAVEAVTFLMVFREIASNIGAIDRVAGYAVGVAAGTSAGLYLNERLSTGQSSVQIIVPGHLAHVGPALHGLGWPVTAHEGSGPLGPVTALLVVVDDVRLAHVLDDVRRVSPEAFVSVHPLRRVHPTPLPHPLRQVGGARRDTTAQHPRSAPARRPGPALLARNQPPSPCSQRPRVAEPRAEGPPCLPSG